jgi:hypothetical protein
MDEPSLLPPTSLRTHSSSFEIARKKTRETRSGRGDCRPPRRGSRFSGSGPSRTRSGRGGSAGPARAREAPAPERCRTSRVGRKPVVRVPTPGSDSLRSHASGCETRRPVRHAGAAVLSPGRPKHERTERRVAFRPRLCPPASERRAGVPGTAFKEPRSRRPFFPLAPLLAGPVPGSKPSGRPPRPTGPPKSR